MKIRVAIIAITKHGAEIASRLALQLPEAEVIVSEKQATGLGKFENPRHIYQGALSVQIGTFFDNYDQLIFLVSLGAVVRLIAPHLKSKDDDPGVLVIDDAAAFVIPVLSGHVGGANAYAEKVAALLNAVPVVTTASDVGKTIPVDILGRELGWKIEAPKINITRVSADVVNQLPIALVQETGSKNWWNRSTPLPNNIHLFERFEEVNLNHYRSVLWITNRSITSEIWQQLEERLVVYRTPIE